MSRISVATTGVFGGKYLPMIKQLALDEQLAYVYGIGFPRGYKFTDEPQKNMRLTKLPSRISGFIVSPCIKLFHLPKYYGYWSSVRLLDFVCSLKLSSDPAKILFSNPLLLRTIKKAKKMGKTVVLEAGNSEPEREHQRICDEYNRFHIKQRYIYGDPVFKNTCNQSFDLADYIVTISEVSQKTYLEAGYMQEKLHLIPLTGTDMPCQFHGTNAGKKKVFITTGFHNFIKGTHRLLLAWKKAGIKEIPLLIVGNVCEDLEEFIKKYGPFENVQFIGHRSDLCEWYLQYDAVGVLMSLSEGAVRVTPEMMSFGFPMIVSPDATCDLIEDDYNGFVVDTMDEETLVKRLRWFADDWNRVYQLRENVLYSVKKRTVKDYSMDLYSFLKQLK